MNYSLTGIKKMKMIRLFGFFAALCLLQNCGTDHIDIVNRTYRLENGTSHEIKMEFYAFGLFQHTRHIIGDGLIFEGSMDNDAGANINAGGALGADSIVVIFDNVKRQFYFGDDILTSNPPTDRNILSEDAYEVISNELYRFVFTEQDYENAEEIGGCG